MAGHLILLGVPCERHIPYFAMPVPRSRENRVESLAVEDHLVRLVGRRCAAWIKDRGERDRTELSKTRNYVPPQTAFYATWLRFRVAEVAAEFLDTYPQHRLEGRIAKLEADCEALTAKLQERLKRGDFNLGRIGDQSQRENLARRYVESAQALRRLGRELNLLERAGEIAQGWQEQL